jgi:hypothetical protein
MRVRLKVILLLPGLVFILNLAWQCLRDRAYIPVTPPRFRRHFT